MCVCVSSSVWAHFEYTSYRLPSLALSPKFSNIHLSTFLSPFLILLDLTLEVQIILTLQTHAHDGSHTEKSEQLVLSAFKPLTNLYDRISDSRKRWRRIIIKFCYSNYKRGSVNAGNEILSSEMKKSNRVIVIEIPQFQVATILISS